MSSNSSPSIPGAWPELQTIDVQPDSPPPQYLDHVLSFHKRLAVSFSSPILMPSRSPLLGISSSASSIGMTIGPQLDTTTSLSALADESISTSCSSDSGLEVASFSRLSESVPSFASPQISRNQETFSALSSPTEHLSKNFRTTPAPRSPPPRLTLSVPDHPSFNENPNTSSTSTSDSPLALPVTPPSPTTPAYPGPIIFASPSSSSFSFSTPFPSLDPVLKKTVDDDALTDWRTRSYSNEHARARPDYSSCQTESYSTVGSSWTSPAHRDDSPLPNTASRLKKPWHDLARDNLEDASPSPLSRKDKRSSDDHHNMPPLSRRVLSAIQTTTPLSSNRSHTLSLSLARPTHARATSSASLLTPTRSRFRFNSISSPRPSFPSRAVSPPPVRSAESESKAHERPRKRSISISLLRSISDHSRARFSRTVHTDDVSIAAVDYAAAQCEAAFVSQTVHEQEASAIGATSEIVENRATGAVNEEVERGDTQVADIANGGEKMNRSVFGKMKKLGGKVRKFVRDVRASLPSIGAQGGEGVKVRVEVMNSQTQTSPQIQPQTNSSSTNRFPSVLNKPPPNPQSKSRHLPRHRPISLSVGAGNFPGYPFIVPVVHVSSPVSSPVGLSIPTFSGSPFASKNHPPKQSSSSPSSTQTTKPVEPKHTKKSDESEATAGSAGGSSTLRKVRNRAYHERSAEERERLRRRRATFSFSRMSNFLG